MKNIICIVGTLNGFSIEVMSGEDLEACNNVVAVHPTMQSADEGLARAQQLEKEMRPLWQAAIEHEQKVRNLMLDAVYKTAKPLVATDVIKHEESLNMTNEQIKHMVNRFLSWKLPENFNPDDGITFDPIVNLGTDYQRRREPAGTNLFDYTQADAMVRYIVDGLPLAIPTISD